MNNADSYSTTIDLLNEIAEFLERQADVRDGSYGEQIPNRAMSLQQLVEQEIERLKVHKPVDGKRSTEMPKAPSASVSTRETSYLVFHRGLWYVFERDECSATSESEK